MVAIFESVLTNISILVLIAYLLTKVPFVKEFISSENADRRIKMLMAVLFGGIGIVSTYIGIPVNGAIANTRVVGILAGGIIGGPFVGIFAGLIAGVHRYAIDVGGFTAFACAISTVTEGLIGGLFSRYLKRFHNDWQRIGLTAMAAELVQMGIILLIARPFSEALELVKLISAPMILVNAFGVVVFIGIFDSVFIEQNKASAERIRLVLSIADQSLPYLRKGLYAKKELEKALKIILDMSDVSGVAVSDGSVILSYAGGGLKHLDKKSGISALVSATLKTRQVQTAATAPPDDIFYDYLTDQNAVCAPLIQKGGEVVGALILFIRKFKHSQEIECEFVSGLAKLFSTQLELSQLENHKELLRKAEITALQSQINPHFFFNALSTIAMFCREKPERARQLLLELSSYFRNTLQLDRDMISLRDEMDHVHAYVELEKARFEDKLQIEERIPENLNCTMPSFILQPILENAIKHGAMQNPGIGKVKIEARRKRLDTVIIISDNGDGIPDEICRKLYSDDMDSACVGLANVHKRLKNIYGEKYGLRITSSGMGSSITIRIPEQCAEAKGEDVS